MGKKYLILIGDGMADEPKDFPDGKTPLISAKTPNLDLIASKGELGLVYTIPEGMSPGSDVANMSILGYNPKEYYSGRAPIEASGLGLKLAMDEIAFRCNLVSLKESEEGLLMDDYSAGHISDEEAKELIDTLNQELGDERVKFYPSVSYRNLCIIKQIEPEAIKIPPPHDISGQLIKKYLPGDNSNDSEKFVLDLMEKSQKLFKGHKVNQARRNGGKKTADSIWLWGQGKTPKFTTFKERYGITGAVVSAVDLIRGLGKLAGLEIIKVPGATGYIDTNFEGKVRASLSALEKGADLVYLHLEAPDEASHLGDLKMKIKAIELFDERILGAMLKGMNRFKEWVILVLPDHTTPIRLKTHHTNPVPFAVIDSIQFANQKASSRGFNELEAKKTGVLVKDGYSLLDRYFFKVKNGKSSGDSGAV